jgi:WXG100 family type VII secretion target
VSVPTPSPTQVVKAYDTASGAWETVSSPLSGAVDASLDFILYPFVTPLLELLELVIGDPDQLDGHAAVWRGVATGLREQAAAHRADLERLRGDWKGEAAEAYAGHVERLAEGLERIAAEMAGTADGLADSATDLRETEKAIRDIIRELVEMLIVTWAAAFALAAITGGGSGAAATAASWVQSAAAFLRATPWLMRLRSWLESYQGALATFQASGTAGKIAGPVVNLVAKPEKLLRIPISAATGVNGSALGVAGAAVDGAVDVYMAAASDESEDRLRGDDGDHSRLRRWVSGHTDPVVDTVDGVRNPRAAD